VTHLAKELSGAGCYKVGVGVNVESQQMSDEILEKENELIKILTRVMHNASWLAHVNQ
jgi:hypothetical protein